MTPSSIFQASALAQHQRESVFGVKPVQRLVKEVVSFRPASNSVEKAVQQAAERISQGKSLFVSDAFAKTQKRVERFE